MPEHAESRRVTRVHRFVGLILMVGCVLAWWAFESVENVLPAPNGGFVTVRGEHFRWSELRGHPVLVTFWASDCGPCVAEIPELEKLQMEWSAQGFQLIAISMNYDLPSRVLALVQSARVSYRVVLDSTGALAAAFGGVVGVPTTFLVAPDGTVRGRFQGPIDFAMVRHRILTMLGES